MGLSLGRLMPAYRIGGLQAILDDLGLYVWMRFNEASGNPANSGTLNLSATQTACTQGKPTIQGLNQAYDFKPAGGVNGSIVTVTGTDLATLAAMTTQRWMFFTKPYTLGPSSAARLFDWGAGGSTEHRMTFVSSNRIQAFVRADGGTDAQALTNTQQIADLLGVSGLVFMDYYDGVDGDRARKIRLWKASKGVVTALTLATDNAAVGSVRTQAGDLYIGNSTGRGFGFHGFIDEAAGGPGLWTMDMMQEITDELAPARTTYYSYVKDFLNPRLLLDFEETSGSPLVDGTESGVTATQTACTQGESGAIATTKAYDFDGASSNGSIVTVSNDSDLGNMTSQRWAFLIKPDTLGALSAGRLFDWGAGGASEHRLNFVSLNRLQMYIQADGGTDAQAVTNTNEISDLIGAWGWIFVDYDEAGTRKNRMWKAINGVVTALTLATDTAAVGNVITQAGSLYIGNSTGRQFTADGDIDLVIADEGLWTTEVMQQLAAFFLAEPYLSGTVYVSKSGNDSNAGSQSAPVLTIARANVIAASTYIDRVMVGAGTYAEEVVPPQAGLTYEADGVVIIDGGSGTRDGFDVNVANVTIRGFHMTGCVAGIAFRSLGDGGRAENCSSTLSTGRGFYAQGASSVVFDDCRSYAPASGYGFEFEAAADNGQCSDCWGEQGQYGFIAKASLNVLFSHCVAIDNTTAGFYSKAGNGMKVWNCVVYGGGDANGNGVYMDEDTGPVYSSNTNVKNTILMNLDRGLYATSSNNATGLASNYNDLYDTDTEGQIGASSYNTLEAWQGAGYDANSVSSDPAYASLVYGGFTLPAGSALLTAGESGGPMGREYA